ncbi:MAG: DUF3450 domain-containing protein [Proteobacteria bacterium]|nr:DUF3450 domain-containing protein [Pseudomonadota bacterium]
MNALKELRKIDVDTKSEEIAGLIQAVFDLDKQTHELDSAFGSQFLQLNNTSNQINDELKRSYKKFVSLEDDMKFVRTEIMKSNYRLDALETELKSLRKDYNKKSESMIGQFNQIINLLTKIADN